MAYLRRRPARTSKSQPWPMRSSHSTLVQRLPRLVERVRIIDGHKDFQLLTVLDQPPAFRDVQLVGMWRAIIVEERLVVKANGIDNERIALVMANRFSVPG